MGDIEEGARLLARARHVVVMIGAGVSAECGVPTFRGADGLWRSYRPEDLATPGAFAADPLTVWQWYEWRRSCIAACLPGAAHHALRELECMKGEGAFLLVSQNVDGLHTRAGVCHSLDIHGSIWRLRCARCAGRRDCEDVPLVPLPPLCESCGTMMRPDVVWFGETLDMALMQSAFENAQRCDLFLAVGTSAVVEPAASLARIAVQAGAELVEINPEDTPLTSWAAHVFRGKAGEILPELVRSSRALPEA